MYGQSNHVPNMDPVSGSLGLPGETTDEFLAADWRSIPKVLFVDDEWEVVNALRRAFLQCPYRIHTTTSPELALQMFRDEPFDVIVADESMPGMLGSELLSIIAQEFPASGRILLTGHGTPETAARAVNDAGVARFLLKPCPAAKLHEAIEAALRAIPTPAPVRTHRRRMFLVSHAAGKSACAPASADTAATTESIKQAWYANELVLQAQKVAGLHDDALLGYEISVRLQAAGGKVHTIGNFISSTQHDVPLSSVDRWVIRHVLESIQEHEQILAQRDVTMSLNVAAGSFRDPGFVRFLNTELTTGRLAARFLVEIRESALAKATGREAGLIERLAKMSCFRSGVRLCIDGVSGMLWQMPSLKTLPVAMAKIDSRFVCDILTNRESEALVRAAVEWGDHAGVKIVATGIDSVAIAQRLGQLGIRFGQGVALGRTESLLTSLAGLYY